MSDEPMMFRRQSDEGAPLGKVSILGCGQVGMACALSLISQGITDELAIVDVLKDKLEGEVKDLQQGRAFTKGARVVGSTDFAVTAGSKICVITAGARQKKGVTRLQLIDQNIEILKASVPQFLKYSPNTILLLVTNPVDVLTYVAWKISGHPVGKVFGTGTSLDTGRLQVLIGDELGISPKCVHMWIVGEHGDSSVPVWSRIQVCGAQLEDMNHPSTIKDPQKLKSLHKQVVNSAYELIKLKGYTSWAIGLNVAHICRSILHNTRNIHALTTSVKGFHGIKDEVFASLPCVVDTNGITYVVPLRMNEEEEAAFVKSAKTILEVQKSTGI